MTSIIDVDGPNSWRQYLLPASFRGVEFHVEQGGVGGGRRTAVHEYPKRNTPYSEDMGRRAQRWSIQAYLIVSPDNPDYVPARDDLMNALDADGPGILVHPTIRQGAAVVVMCEHWSITETREKGGFVLFEMDFVERGAPINQDNVVATNLVVGTNSQFAQQTGAGSLDQQLSGSPTMSSAATTIFQALQQGTLNP